MKTEVKEGEVVSLVFQVIREETMFSRSDIRKKNRKRELSTARIITAVILNKVLEYNVSEVGFLIDRDHSTILYLVDKHEAHYQYDISYRNFYDNIVAKLIDTKRFNEQSLMKSELEYIKIYLETYLRKE